MRLAGPFIWISVAVLSSGGCGSTAKTGLGNSAGSCYDSNGAIATRAKACSSASDCEQVVEPRCCAPVMEVGLAKSSFCTFPTPSCANVGCPSFTSRPEQAEDGENTVEGGSIGLACVGGQCMTFVRADGVDAGADADSDTRASDTVSCVDWYRYPIPGTDNLLINNVWNEQHARTYPYHQCLTKRTVNGKDQYGWSWDWPPCDTSTSFAAPEVMFGRKPWDGGASTNSALPRRIDAVQGLLVDFGVDIAADACYNLNATMWLTQSAAAPADPNPQDITTEVMVRFNDAGHIGGCCTPDGDVTLGGIAFQVWHQDAHSDTSGATTYTWKMVIYESSTPIADARFDLGLVLQDMVSRGLVQAANAVQGVELITEVSGGSGQLRLNRFDVTVQ